MSEENKCITFLKEYRAHPERYLPMVDHQYNQFDKWEDEIVRNMCWSAGILNGNRPYFAECWKVFLTTAMTVFFSAAGYDHGKSEPFFLMELIRAGLVIPRSADLNHLRALRYTDGSGNEFIAFNFVLDIEESGQYMSWLGSTCRFDELNRLNDGPGQES